jgi:L-threonylcarbamoyladenylate synthase
LGIKNIISPSYVIYYEYQIHLKGEIFYNKLLHIDLYNINEPEEFKYLYLENYLNKKNILCFEWGEKAGEILPILKEKGRIIYIRMKYIDRKRRELQVNFQY